MAGNFWKSSNNSDLRSSMGGSRMDYPAYGGQNVMNRGYGNGMGSNAALGLAIKGMTNQRSDMSHDRGQYQTGLDSYGASHSFNNHFQGANQRQGMDPYYGIGRPLVDSYRDHYRGMDNSYNASLYMPRESYLDSMQHSSMAQFSSSERSLFASENLHQGGQFGPSSPQVAGGRKRAAGWDNGRGAHMPQVHNNRSKRGKVAQVPTLSQSPARVKSVTGNDVGKLPQEADVVNALTCVVCDLSDFNSIQEYKNHLSTKEHKQILDEVRLRDQANLDYLRLEAKLASKRHISEGRKLGINNNNQKLLQCSMCKCEYFGGFNYHKSTIEHDQIFKFDQPRCCGKAFCARDKLVDHEISIDHIQAQCKEQLTNSNSSKTEVSGKMKHFHEGNHYNVGVNTIGSYQPHKPFALQVLSEHVGYACELCPDSNDLTVQDIKTHCMSLSHYQSIMDVLLEKSNKSDAMIKKAMKSKLKYSNQVLPEEEEVQITQEVVEQCQHNNQTLEEDDLERVGGEDIDEDALDFEYV